MAKELSGMALKASVCRALLIDTGILTEEVISTNKLSNNDIVKIFELVEAQKLKKTVSFTILGDPSAWNRAIKTKTHFYDPNVGYKAYLVDAILNTFGTTFVPTQEAVEIEIRVFKPIPKTTPIYKRIAMEKGIIRPISKPDFDNYAKNVADALNTIFYSDDAQIIGGIVEKYYSEKPRLEITLHYF